MNFQHSISFVTEANKVMKDLQSNKMILFFFQWEDTGCRVLTLPKLRLVLPSKWLHVGVENQLCLCGRRPRQYGTGSQVLSTLLVTFRSHSQKSAVSTIPFFMSVLMGNRGSMKLVEDERQLQCIIGSVLFKVPRRGQLERLRSWWKRAIVRTRGDFRPPTKLSVTCGGTWTHLHLLLVSTFLRGPAPLVFYCNFLSN